MYQPLLWTLENIKLTRHKLMFYPIKPVSYKLNCCGTEFLAPSLPSTAHTVCSGYNRNDKTLQVHIIKVCSHYEINVHWKRINSHCLHSHRMCINRNSHWMCIQLIHFHRWFEAGLKVNYIMTWIIRVLYFHAWSVACRLK